MTKRSEKVFVCENCGNIEPRWTGKCVRCGEWNTFVEKETLANEKRIINSSDNSTKLVSLGDVEKDEKIQRLSTNFKEFDRVLGGGLVSEEVVLLAGDPGIGKSTLILQTLANLSKDKKVLYVSGEESARQVALRASRLFKKTEDYKEINFLSSGNLDLISNTLNEINPGLVVIDSIQTINDPESSSLPGSIVQIRNCTAKLISLAKSQGFIMIIIGHITKEGEIGGPKLLEHLVDAVLQFEGDNKNDYRILRSLKNRYGPTGEVGIFSMTQNGLQDINLTENTFNISVEKEEIGVAKTFAMEGSRPILLDIQTLASSTVFAYPKRVSEGLNVSRLQLLCAIVQGLRLSNLSTKDVYLRVSGGYKINENAFNDLAVIASLISSSNKKALPTNYIYIGEVSLNGRIYLPNRLLKAFNELARVSAEYKFVTSSSIKSSLSKELISRCIFLNNISELK